MASAVATTWNMSRESCILDSLQAILTKHYQLFALPQSLPLHHYMWKDWPFRILSHLPWLCQYNNSPI